MKHLQILLFCFLGLGLISFGQSGQKNKKNSKSNQTELTDQQLILQTEEEFRKAKIDNNVDVIDKILAKDYNGTNQHGTVTDKDQAKKLFSNFKNHTLIIDSAKVTMVSPTIATVNGFQTEDDVTMSFERNYVKQNGKWQILFSSQKMLEYKSAKGIGRYRIVGNLKGADGVAISLMKNQGGRITNLNAAVVNNGIFVMEGKAIEYPDMVFLTTPGKNERAMFFLENAEINITGHLDSLSKVKIAGSKTQNEYMALKSSVAEFIRPYGDKSKEFKSAMDAKDTVRMMQIRKEMNAVMSEVQSMQKEFVKNNTHSYAVPSILQELSNSISNEELESLVNALDPDVGRTQTAISIKARVKAVKKVAVGQKAPDFTLNDVKGNPVSLSSKIGPKLLLVDFWAAWCGPCRAENPNVVRVFNEFKDKGFDVLGVSLDRTKDDWIKAIEKDNLTWTHISDLQYWNSAAARLYAVSSIPANFLLDQNGIIVARNIRGEALYEKVRELLGEK